MDVALAEAAAAIAPEVVATPEEVECVGETSVLTATSENVRGMSFNGTTSSIEVPSSTDFQIAKNKDFSIEMWIHPTEAKTGGLFTRRSGGGDNQLYTTYNGNQSVTFGMDKHGFGWAWVFTPANSVPLNKWTHVAFTMEANVLKTYINLSLIHI